jgi:hypothetical protein
MGIRQPRFMYYTLAFTAASVLKSMRDVRTPSLLIAVRALIAAGFLALLVGCLPRTNHPAAPAPTGVTASAGDAQVTLSWTASSGATGYNVKRSTKSGGPYTTLGSPATATYVDSTVSNGTTYFYVVSSLNSAGEGINSAEVSATPQAAPLTIPTGVSAVAGNAVVTLTWSSSSGATSYHVKRATTSGGPYTQIAAPTSPTYADSTVTNGTTYYYVVSSVNSGGESANSVEVKAVPNVMNPPPPTFGTWIDVTPSGVDLTSTLCGNYGSQSVQPDTANPSHLYTQFDCQGIWKSTDFGATWTGPINTGTNGATVADCGSGITVSPSSTAGGVPTVYAGCIRGNGTGFWKSVDGGVNWTHYVVGSSANRQDYYPPVVDPYDLNHLLLAGHEFDSIVESTDGGQAWTNVSLASGMLQNGGTGFIFFINTASATTTRGTWLWIAQGSGGKFGTWRTTNSGATWVRVDLNEHILGAAQIYQPDTSGVIFMAGQSSALGQGILRSTDYGQTWIHVGLNDPENVVVGTAKNVYGMVVGPGNTQAPFFEVATQPGTGTWVEPGTPANLIDGAAQIGVVNDGTHNILVGAMWNVGVWRYIEP